MATPREIVERWDRIEGRQAEDKRRRLLDGPPTGYILVDGKMTPVWMPDGPPPGVTLYVMAPGSRQTHVSRETPSA